MRRAAGRETGRFAVVGSGGTSSKQREVLGLVAVVKVAGSEGVRYCRVDAVNYQAGAGEASSSSSRGRVQVGDVGSLRDGGMRRIEALRDHWCLCRCRQP